MNKELTIDLKNNLGKLEIITLTFQNTPEDSAVSNDLLKLNNGLVDIEKVRFLNNKKHKKLCRLQIYIDDFFSAVSSFRHEEVPAECQQRTTKGHSGSASVG